MNTALKVTANQVRLLLSNKLLSSLNAPNIFLLRLVFTFSSDKKLRQESITLKDH